MGANPNCRLGKDFLSPLEWAAYYHHTVCLKIMIDHLENTATVPNTTEGKRDLRHAVFYGPLVRNALHASDKFSMIIRNDTNYLTNLKSTLALLQEKTKLVRFNLGQYQTPLHFAAREAHDETCEVILELGWFTDDINIPAGPEKRTPLLESVHWNRPNLFRLLRNHGADIHALCMSPFEGSEQRTWSALHVMANQAQNNEFALVDEILAAGLPVDGNPEAEMETAFNIAVCRNGFKLAEKLRTHGANPDATRKQSALLIAPYPLTVLGHEIARNARYGLAAIRYLLALRPRPSFIVEPERGLTALHLVAMVPDGFTYVGGGELNRADFDWETNCAIAQELRTWFTEPDELNAQCLQGKTALHLAAERGNALVVEELVRAGASLEVRCEVGERPADIARRWFGEKGQEDKLRKLLEWLE